MLKPFRGYFYTSKLNPNIPTVIHYSIENFLNLKKDYELSSFLSLKQAICFSSKDHLFDFYLNQEYNTVLIIKEKGYGKKEPLEKDLTDYDWLESYSAIQDIAFVCVFESILNIEFLKLNQIKRRTYDLIKHSNRWMLLNYVSIFKYNINYFKLKKEIAVLNLTTSRYKNEFSKNSILFLTNRYGNLSNYNYVSVFKNEKKIKLLENKKQDLNDVFKSIEELNSYRTNFTLQIASIVVTLLAFIFAFDKIKTFFSHLFLYIFE